MNTYYSSAITARVTEIEIGGQPPSGRRLAGQPDEQTVSSGSRAFLSRKSV